MEGSKTKKKICKLCAWKFEDESLYEVHMSYVHKNRDELELDVQANVNKYVNKLVYLENTQKTQQKDDTIDSNSNPMAVFREIKKIYKCNICDVKFTENGSLKRHLVSVHGWKLPFYCNICDAKFVNRSNLKMHISSVHEKNKIFQCDICDANFSQKGSLERHIEGMISAITPL